MNPGDGKVTRPSAGSCQITDEPTNHSSLGNPLPAFCQLQLQIRRPSRPVQLVYLVKVDFSATFSSNRHNIGLSLSGVGWASHRCGQLECNKRRLRDLDQTKIAILLPFQGFWGLRGRQNKQVRGGITSSGHKREKDTRRKTAGSTHRRSLQTYLRR